MPITDRAGQADAIRRTLTKGGNLLIVGAKGANFPETIRDHPRVRVWDSVDPAAGTREIPENTRVIICLRFISHALFARLNKWARAKQIVMVPGLNSTGEIKDILQMALNIPKEFLAPAPEVRPALHSAC